MLVSTNRHVAYIISNIITVVTSNKKKVKMIGQVKNITIIQKPAAPEEMRK